MKRVNRREISLAEDGLYYHQGEPFTGVASTEFENGSPRSETHFKDGLGHGLARDWHKNGQLASETHLVRDAQHGIAREWNEDGVLQEESVAEYGIVVRERRWEDGDLVEEYELKEGDPDYERLKEYQRLFAEDKT